MRKTTENQHFYILLTWRWAVYKNEETRSLAELENRGKSQEQKTTTEPQKTLQKAGNCTQNEKPKITRKLLEANNKQKALTGLGIKTTAFMRLENSGNRLDQRSGSRKVSGHALTVSNDKWLQLCHNQSWKQNWKQNRKQNEQNQQNKIINGKTSQLVLKSARNVSERLRGLEWEHTSMQNLWIFGYIHDLAFKGCSVEQHYWML